MEYSLLSDQVDSVLEKQANLSAGREQGSLRDDKGIQAIEYWYIIRRI